ncbi:hypothetical protein IWQ60_011251 [Tieghemiomyces parasiticus]|uniref:Zn(2)-C6 fungal-type domain-containing protein n=1 Tax=Tieghemiomyces parasiticus TaxID=78921 RepID=A0A9W7ZPD0_9FUNG|nr:hypothetical protein IWQ60_011251 [Tieghemiomyces parasiticus]
MSPHTQCLPIARLQGPAQPRARFSCQTCRTRKAKCDKQLPHCTGCLQRDLECQYLLTPARLRDAIEVLSAAIEDPPGTPKADNQTPAGQSATLETSSLSAYQPSPVHCLQSSASPPSFAYENGASCQTPTLVPSPPSTDPADQLNDLALPDNEGYFEAVATNPIVHTPVLLDVATVQVSPQGSEEASSHSLAFRFVSRMAEELWGIESSTRSSTADPSELFTASSAPDMQSPSLYRPMFMNTDLLFHSEVLRYVVYQACHRAYGQFADLQYQRAILRLHNHTMPPELQVVMALISTFAERVTFQSTQPVGAIGIYQSYLRHTVGRFADGGGGTDAFTLLCVTAEVCQRLGAYSQSVALIISAIRQHQVARAHLIDQKPRPPPLPNSTFDATRLRDPLLINHFRIAWWLTITRDALNAIIFGLRPAVRLDEFRVLYPEQRHPKPPPGFIAAATRDDSEMNTSPNHPTFFLSLFDFPAVQIDCDLSCLIHLVATTRSYLQYDVPRWQRYWRRACQAIDRWQVTSKSLRNVTSYHLSSSRDSAATDRPQRLPMHELYVGQSYYLLLIYLHHLDGVVVAPQDTAHPNASPLSTLLDEDLDGFDEGYYGDLNNNPITIIDDDDGLGPGPTEATPNQLGTTSPQTGSQESDKNRGGEITVPSAILRLCDQRCWEAVLDLRQHLANNIDNLWKLNTSLFIGNLNAAGVVCIEVLHGRRHAPDPMTGVPLAATFLNEILGFLARFSSSKPGNLRLIASLESLRDTPPTTPGYYSVTLEHLL